MNKEYTVCLAFLTWLLLLLASPAQAAAPIALLKSAKNAEAYQLQNIGNFEEDWQAFRRTLESANLRYDTVTDGDLTAARLGQYRVLLVPLLVDIPADSLDTLKQYTAAGGKLLLTDGGGTPSKNAASLDAAAGASITNHNTMQDAQQLVWAREGKNYTQDFAVGTLVAEVQGLPAASVLARWVDASGKALAPAIVKANGNIFIGWAPGLQGETSTNASILTLALDEAAPGLSRAATIQINTGDYQKLQADLDNLQKRTEDAIATARQADLSVPLNVIQKHYDQALIHARTFKDFYFQGKSFEADGELSAARKELSLAFALAMPVRLVEARSIWLDRGTIVSCVNQSGMAVLFNKLKKTGINVVYFETNNAGFTMFPSKVALQNPQTASWDPLACAIQEAHKRGMELHAWLWIFNVGNTFHNPIIMKEPDFAGPVLTRHDFTWALQSGTGSLIPPKQHEFWLDPSCPEARAYIKSLVLEVVKNYAVDGIQLDYIRYPFNGKGGEMGFDFTGRLNFERETHLALDRLDDKTRKAWIAWKTRQVSTLVQEISSLVRSTKPSVKISCAVYAIPHDQRLSQIQQEWESWVASGWVDTLNPMTYVAKGSELQKAAGYVKDSAGNKVMVLPGLFMKDLDTASLVEQLDVSRGLGLLGNTMFAAAQLDENKMSLLQIGPYRKPPLMTPQSNPVRAATIVIDSFARSISRYVQDPERPIIADRALTNDILTQTESIQKILHAMPANASTAQIAAVADLIDSLNTSVKDWLSIETFAKRAPRANYISSTINQASYILGYAAHKSKAR
jgi:uncharacterized lipoprotein YddW (UPF0748 family)